MILLQVVKASAKLHNSAVLSRVAITLILGEAMRIGCSLTFCVFLLFTSTVNAQQADALSPLVHK
jgi:hypothetical protein